MQSLRSPDSKEGYQIKEKTDGREEVRGKERKVRIF